MLNKFLQTLDLFGTPLTINYCGKEKSKSKLGGICSLLYLGLVAWVTYTTGKDLLSRTNPTSITSESYVEYPRQMLISPETFPLAFFIQAPDTHSNDPFLDESIFKLTVEHVLIQRTQNESEVIETEWKPTFLKTERCTPEHFGNDLYPSFSIVDFQFSYCIDRNQPPIKIQGVFEASLYQSIEVKVRQCDNATSEIPCAPQEVIDEYLSGSWFNALYANMAVDPKNFSHPDSRFRDIYYTMMSPANFKYSEIELGHVQVSTDAGWLIEDIRIQEYTKINKITENLQFKPHPEKILMHCTFQVSKLEQSYLRTYKKFQNVLAEVGGLANGSMMILLLLTTPYLKLKVRESLLNELFNQYISKKDVLKQSLSKNKNRNLKNKIPQSEIKNEGNKLKGRQVKDKNNLKLENKAKSILDTLDKKTGINSQIFLSQIDIKEEDINEKYKGGKKQNEIEIYRNEDETKSNSWIKNSSPPKFSLYKEEITHNLTDKSSFKNANSFEHPLSPKINALEIRGNVKLENIPHKVRALKPNFKVLEEPEDENPEDPSMVLANFTSDDNRTVKRNDSHEKNIRVKKIKKEEDRITTLEQELNSKNNKYLIESAKEYSQSESETQNNLERKPDEELTTLDLTLCEYVCSFFYRSKSFKQKMDLLNKGIRRTNERLDMLNILKKLREVDKLKALLLDDEQLIMFNNLPKPDIRLNKLEFGSFSSKLLRKSIFVERSHTEKQILESCQKVKNRLNKTEIDKRLLRIFNERDK